MNTQENKDFIDPGSDPISDDFDPFASDDELDAEISAVTTAPQQQETSTPPTLGNPLENAINTAETKEAEKAQQGLFGKLPVFEYAGATEEIDDDSKTFDELRIEKAADFPELDDGKRVSWTVEYGKITKSVSNPKATSIGKIKSEIETSKEFLDSLKKAKDKNPICKIKPRITAQSKGIASYKGIFRTIEEAEASEKHIRILPAKDGHVYEIRCTEAGKFIARVENVHELSEVSAGFVPAFPPVPFALFAQVLAFFRHYMQDGRETEVMVYIYWDKVKAEYIIRVPMQRVSKAHISVVIPPDETIDSDRYVHVADIHSHNPHAHIMLIMRPFESNGSWDAKSKKEYILDDNGERIVLKSGEYKSRKVDAVDWNNQDNAEIWRAAWADMCNQYLERNNATERIDNRSYERQGIDQIPTIHLGTAAFQMEKRGIRTERGDINREIEVSNQHLRELKARIVRLQNWLKEEQENTEPPTLADVISNILTRREQVRQSSRYSSINNLQAAANLLNFLTTNNIMDMAGLDEKVKSMIAKQFVIRDELKPIERRLKTLDEHMRHSENFKNNRAYKTQYEKLYAQYTTLKKATGFGAGRKSQKALDAANEYYETQRSQIVLYESAERYLKDVLQGRFDVNKLPPITKWKAERDKLYIEKNRLDLEYVSLRHETAEVEKIRSSVYYIMREESRGTQRTRRQDLGR